MRYVLYTTQKFFNHVIHLNILPNTVIQHSNIKADYDPNFRVQRDTHRIFDIETSFIQQRDPIQSSCFQIYDYHAYIIFISYDL